VNFLAHLHLSDGTPGSMLGGVVADFVKGPAVAALPADVREGVRLHRLIDGFTDRHPIVQRSVGRLGAKLGWFAGIVVDIYYDHVLARDWAAYSAEPLRAFADRAYAALEEHLAVVPDEAERFVRGFIDDDRLVRYATPDGIADTLARVSRRIARRIPNRAVRLELAMPDLLAADRELAADFHAFYPELVRFAVSQHPGANTDPPTASPSG
jgi:acyl carrier protein phosphodiesterase